MSDSSYREPVRALAPKGARRMSIHALENEPITLVPGIRHLLIATKKVVAQRLEN